MSNTLFIYYYPRNGVYEPYTKCWSGGLDPRKTNPKVPSPSQSWKDPTNNWLAWGTDYRPKRLVHLLLGRSYEVKSVNHVYPRSRIYK